MEEEGFNLMIKRLRRGTRSFQLLELFSTYGAVLKTSVYHKSRGFVKFQFHADASRALQEVKSINGKLVEICWSERFNDVVDLVGRPKKDSRTLRGLPASYFEHNEQSEKHCTATLPEAQCNTHLECTTDLSSATADATHHHTYGTDEPLRDPRRRAEFDFVDTAQVDSSCNENHRDENSEDEFVEASQVTMDFNENGVIPEDVLELRKVSWSPDEDTRLRCSKVVPKNCSSSCLEDTNAITNCDEQGQDFSTIATKEDGVETIMGYVVSPQHLLENLHRIFGFLGVRYKEKEYTYMIDKPEVTFGRHLDCNVRLSGIKTSRYQCLMVVGFRNNTCQARLKHTGSDTSKTRLFTNGEYGPELTLGQWVDLDDQANFCMDEFHFQWRVGNRADPLSNQNGSVLLMLNNGKELGRLGIKLSVVKLSGIQTNTSEINALEGLFYIREGINKSNAETAGGENRANPQNTPPPVNCSDFANKMRMQNEDPRVSIEPRSASFKANCSADGGSRDEEAKLIDTSAAQELVRILPDDFPSVLFQKDTGSEKSGENLSEICSNTISHGNGTTQVLSSQLCTQRRRKKRIEKLRGPSEAEDSLGETKFLGENSFYCGQCNLFCATSNKLRIHKKTKSHLYVVAHPKEDWKPFCAVCRLTFKGTPALVQHKLSKKHLAKCGKSDIILGQDAATETTQVVINKIECLVCQTSYANHSGLERHFKTMTHRKLAIELERSGAISECSDITFNNRSGNRDCIETNCTRDMSESSSSNFYSEDEVDGFLFRASSKMDIDAQVVKKVKMTKQVSFVKI